MPLDPKNIIKKAAQGYNEEEEKGNTGGRISVTGRVQLIGMALPKKQPGNHESEYAMIIYNDI